MRALVGTVLFILAVIIAPASFGQGITGSITGTVTDTSGAPIAGATVAIRQQGTDASRTLVTSDVGSYRITQLAPGTYNVQDRQDRLQNLSAGKRHPGD